MRTGRLAFIALGVSVLAVVPLVAHVAEDVGLGVHERFGLSPLAAGVIAGAATALELGLAVALVRGRRWAGIVLVVVATGWALFAAIDHPGAHRLGEYRGGIWSWLVLWSMVALQAVVAVTAAAAVRRRGPG